MLRAVPLQLETPARMFGHVMRPQSVHGGSETQSLLAIALILGVLALGTWSVVGKYRLDRDARQIYKASRPLISENDAPAPLPGVPPGAIAFSPPSPSQPIILLRPVAPLAWRCGGPLPARSPPLV